MIKFSDTFFFNNWKRKFGQTVDDNFTVWILWGFEDDCILIEPKIWLHQNTDKHYWQVYFISFRRTNEMKDLKDIYTKMYGDIKFDSTEKAKDHINKFLMQVQKLKSFI